MSLMVLKAMRLRSSKPRLPLRIAPSNPRSSRLPTRWSLRQGAVKSAARSPHPGRNPAFRRALRSAGFRSSRLQSQGHFPAPSCVSSSSRTRAGGAHGQGQRGDQFSRGGGPELFGSPADCSLAVSRNLPKSPKGGGGGGGRAEGQGGSSAALQDLPEQHAQRLGRFGKTQRGHHFADLLAR